jgi:DcaP outer membrane protein
MRRIGAWGIALFVAVLASPAYAQAPAMPERSQDKSQEQKPSVEELLRRLDALQHRVDELEGRERHAKSPAYAAHHAPVGPAPTEAPQAAQAAPPRAASASAATAAAALQAAPIPGLRPPEAMGHNYDTEEALRSDLPGLSLRIPGSQSEVRFYGFANVNAYRDFNARNQTDAPAPQSIPLAASANALQGGDFGMTARFSRFGIDSRTLTDWGTLETRVEGDFGGGSPVSTNAPFRLRLAFGELGTEQFRVLVGQANSLWNEGVFETVNFATNLNQSFVRQPQIRAIATLAPGLTGQLSLEMPDTQFTSVAGVFTPTVSPIGGLSPAFNSLPDLLGRLTYNYDGMILDTRGLLRDLSARTAGTAAAPPALKEDALGWGVAETARFPMRWLSSSFGPDELIGMAYYGQGIGRYFGSNTFGQDALTNLGLPGTTTDFSLDPITTYGATAAYRRFWTTQLRSNVAYSYAKQDFPTYALLFTPGTISATSLNSNIEQATVNLIWSPFAELRGNTVGTGWLDVGLEYVYTHREVFGGSPATLPVGLGYATANRIYASVTARF